ncbi:MAG TPA: chromate transporter, partial [Acidimicrobiales bacterium]|nr:chromate transporter [Acidimicrobiales bacterium]
GYAAAGAVGAALAALVAFSPSFLFIVVGGTHFDRLRADRRAQAFLGGAGPAAIGAILGAALPLATALSAGWQVAVLATAGVLLLVLRREIVPTLLASGVAGAVLVGAGAPLPG